MRKTERRTFLKTTGLGTIVWGLTDRASHAASGQQKLVVGVIGTGGMGSSHTRELAGRADVELAYVCDVNQNRLKIGRDLAESRAGTGPRRHAAHLGRRAGRLRSRDSLLRHERDARVERVLRFDPETESITEDDVANHLVRRQYRNGHWTVPQGA